jgi:hypothetical protein
VPGVALTLTNVDTNVSLSTVSTENGSFVFPPLIPGSYRVTAELAGFKRFVRDGIVLRVQDKVDLAIGLEVGDVSTSVEVQQQLSQIQTATATIGQGIDSRLISELPLNGRNPYLLAGLSTGVLVHNPPAIQRTFDVGGTNSITTGAGPSRRGGGNNEFILDGAPAEGALNFVPSVSATQEFKVQTNTPSTPSTAAQPAPWSTSASSRGQTRCAARRMNSTATRRSMPTASSVTAPA